MDKRTYIGTRKINGLELYIAKYVEDRLKPLQMNNHKPFSVMNNSGGWRTAAAGNVGAAVVAQVAYSGRLRTDAVICSWKGL